MSARSKKILLLVAAGALLTLNGFLLPILNRQRGELASPEAELAIEETGSGGSVVADVLEGLPPEERVVLEWKYLDRCTVREIAQRLGRTEKAVEALLYRARNAFRTAYETAME